MINVFVYINEFILLFILLCSMLIGRLVFYGISTFVGYLMPILFIYIYIYIYIYVCVCVCV